MTEHGGTTRSASSCTARDDRAALRKAGLHLGACWSRTSSPRTPARRAAARRGRRRCPSGRTSYRTLADYETELKALAAAEPDARAAVHAPEQDVRAAATCSASRSPRTSPPTTASPAFLNMGVHHAREWPAGELTMEWAYELINGYKAGDPRATNIVQQQPQHRRADRQPGRLQRLAQRAAAPADGRDETIDDTVYIATSPGRVPAQELPRRRHRRPRSARSRSAWPRTAWTRTATTASSGAARARTRTRSPRPTAAPAPFSEPESRNIQWLVSHNQVTTLITNHTTAGLVLRAPGLAAVGDPVDENRGYKALGDAMAKRERLLLPEGLRALRHHGHDRGLELQRHRRLRLHVRALLRRAQLRHRRLRRRRPSTRASRRWPRSGTARAPQADHVGDPGRQPSTARATARPTTSPPRARSTRRATRSSRAPRPPARALRLTKEFKTDDVRRRADRSTTTSRRSTTSAPSGAFRWHVNPSTRPIVAKAVGSPQPGHAEPRRRRATRRRVADDDAGAAIRSSDHAVHRPGRRRQRAARRSASSGRRR